MKRGMVFGAIIVGALLAFELFNYTTTDFALTDLLGDMRFAGVRWAMILALAFCGMDFAGIARLFTPEKGRDERLEVWYLLGAWFLAATMNAMLTWWGVSIALLNHNSLGNAIISHDKLLAIVPVFVAVLVWLIRILMIGTFSMAGERLFTQAETSLRRADIERFRSARPALKSLARVIGDDSEDDFDQRPQPLGEGRGGVRQAPTAASLRPAAPSTSMTRPAPKPSASGAPAYTPSAVTGVRPAVTRTSGASGRPGPERH